VGEKRLDFAPPKFFLTLLAISSLRVPA